MCENVKKYAKIKISAMLESGFTPQDIIDLAIEMKSKAESIKSECLGVENEGD